MERKVHSDLRLSNMPTRTWIRFQMTSYHSMLHKTNLNKTEIAGDDRTAVVPLAGRTRLHELNAPWHLMVYVTYDETSTK